MRKAFDYEMLQPGEVLGRRRVTITDDMIRTCAAAIESDHPWYCDASPCNMWLENQDAVRVTTGIVSGLVRRNEGGAFSHLQRP